MVTGFGVFCHIKELEAEIRSTSNGLLSKVSLQTNPDFFGSVMIDSEGKNWLKKCRGEVTNDKLVLFVPDVESRIGCNEKGGCSRRGIRRVRSCGGSSGGVRGGGGCGGYGGRIRAINELPQVMADKEHLDLVKPEQVVGFREFDEIGSVWAEKGGRGVGVLGGGHGESEKRVDFV